MSNGSVRWLDDAEQAAWRSYIAASTRLLERLDTELRAATPLDLADYEILVRLSEAPERRMRMSELAASVLVSRSRLTHRVNRLVDRGLVRRKPCPTDKRGAFAELSARGLRTLERAAPLHVEGVRRHFVDTMGPTQLAALRRATDEMLRQLDAVAD